MLLSTLLGGQNASAVVIHVENADGRGDNGWTPDPDLALFSHRHSIQKLMLELEPFDALALPLHHSPGIYALLVGSGLSRAAGVPTGWEITLDLIRRLDALDGITEPDDWEARFGNKYSKEPNHSEVLDALAAKPSERHVILQRYIEPDEGENARRPTKAHHAIAKLVVDGAVCVILTTISIG